MWRTDRCIMCYRKTSKDECLHSEDFNAHGPNVPLCPVCEDKLDVYLKAIIFAKAMWVN